MVSTRDYLDEKTRTATAVRALEEARHRLSVIAALHVPILHVAPGQAGTDGTTICAEDHTPYPCRTKKALDQ